MSEAIGTKRWYVTKILPLSLREEACSLMNKLKMYESL